MKIPRFLKQAVWATLAVFVLLHLGDALGRLCVPCSDCPWFFGQPHPVWTIVRVVVTYTLLPVAAVLVFGRWARLLLIPGFCYALLADVAVAYTYAVYNAALAGLWPTVFANTSAEETLAFLKMSLTPGGVAGAVGTLAALVAGVWLLATARYPRVTRRSAVLGLALTLPFLVLNILTMNPRFGIRETLYSDFVIRSAQCWQRLKGIGKACAGEPNLPKRLELSVAETNAPNVVIVIGESASRNYWHLYGYPRATTPRLDTLCADGQGGVCFRDVVSPHGETTEAVCMLLSDVTIDNPSDGNWTLAEVYRRAGYRGVFVNNQFLWRFDMDVLLSQIFNGCETKINLPAVFANENGGKVYDERTVEFLRRELARDDSRPAVVFVHLAGLHMPVEDACPKSDAYFTDNVDGACLQGLSAEQRDRRNRYDDGIRYEDKVLGALIDALEATSRRPSCLFFISDHGESPRAKSWRDFGDLDVYEVPMVVWFSESYRRAFPDVVAGARRAAGRPMQSDELTFGLIELGRIRGLGEDASRRSFLSEGFSGRVRRKINKGRIDYPRERRSRAPASP